MSFLTWLFFFIVIAGFIAWIVGGIIRRGHLRAAASARLEARAVDEAREYQNYLAGVGDPRD